jgi:hypothetical protein
VPIISISISRSKINRIGLLSFFVAAAATTATNVALVSLPPNSPPIRLTLQTTLFEGTPNASATSF